MRMRPVIHAQTKGSRIEYENRRVTHGRDAVSVATVDNGSSLRAEGSVIGNGLSDNTSEGTSGQGESSSDRETHFE